MLKPNTAIRKQKIGKYTYVFLDKNRYSPETKRVEHERKYLGKLEDGLFVPNKEYKEELAYDIYVEIDINIILSVICAMEWILMTARKVN